MENVGRKHFVCNDLFVMQFMGLNFNLRDHGVGWQLWHKKYYFNIQISRFLCKMKTWLIFNLINVLTSLPHNPQTIYLNFTTFQLQFKIKFYDSCISVDTLIKSAHLFVPRHDRLSNSNWTLAMQRCPGQQTMHHHPFTAITACSRK